MNRTLSHLRARAAACTHDLSMVPIAWLGVFWLHFNLATIPNAFWNRAVILLPVVRIAQGGTFWYFGLFRALGGSQL